MLSVSRRTGTTTLRASSHPRITATTSAIAETTAIITIAFASSSRAVRTVASVYSLNPSKSAWKGELILVFQKIESLHKACPKSRGDWYFTGDYPTPGGLGVLNQAYINYWEKREGRSY
jgi:hypothetical protein